MKATADRVSGSEMTLTITRIFDAPRDLVWRMWSEKHLMMRWSCPTGFTIPYSDPDFRVGGSWQAHMRSPQGEDYRLQGVYREIVPGQRLVFTHAWLDERGTPGPETLVTITLQEDRGKTRMDFVQSGFESESSRNGHEDGWGEALEKFEALVDTIKGSDRSLIFTRLFAAPPGTVFACFHDPVHISNWWGPNGFRTTTYEMDFRVGGRWRFTMHGPDGTDYPNLVSYKEIVPSRRIAYDHGTGPENPKMFEAEISFAEEGGKTRVNLQLTLHDAEQRDHMIAFGAVEGGWQTLSRLDAFLNAKG